MHAAHVAHGDARRERRCSRISRRWRRCVTLRHAAREQHLQRTVSAADAARRLRSRSARRRARVPSSAVPSQVNSCVPAVGRQRHGCAPARRSRRVIRELHAEAPVGHVDLRRCTVPPWLSSRRCLPARERRGRPASRRSSTCVERIESPACRTSSACSACRTRAELRELAENSLASMRLERILVLELRESSAVRNSFLAELILLVSRLRRRCAAAPARRSDQASCD